MIVSGSSADFAWHEDIRKEVHLYLDDTIAAAVLAASALYVEAEPACLIAPYFGLRHLCKQIADVCKHTRISRGIGARRLAYRRLVYVYDLVEILYTFDLAELARAFLSAVGDT